MNASILDLRYHMKDILQALDRREEIRILYHGRLKGILCPPKTDSKQKVKDSAFFGMNKEYFSSVEDQVQNLRGSRYNGL